MFWDRFVYYFDEYLTVNPAITHPPTIDTSVLRPAQQPSRQETATLSETVINGGPPAPVPANVEPPLTPPPNLATHTSGEGIDIQVLSAAINSIYQVYNKALAIPLWRLRDIALGM